MHVGGIYEPNISPMEDLTEANADPIERAAMVNDITDRVTCENAGDFPRRTLFRVVVVT